MTPGAHGITSRGPRRITGIDVARGIAVLTMFVAHLAYRGPGTASLTWITVCDGRPSILFATLAGVSLALMSGRGSKPVDVVSVRLRLLVRALIIYAIGSILTAAGTMVIVILEYYAVMFVLAIPFLYWSTRRLIITVAGIALLAPIAACYLEAFTHWKLPGPAEIVRLGWSGPYPVLVWMAFVLAGVALGRIDWTNRSRLATVGAIATAVSVAGYAGGWLTTEWFGHTDRGYADATQGTWIAPSWTSLTGAEPHTSTTFELLGSGGLAIALICLCVLATGPLRLLPLAAVGSMALTVYTVQIAAIYLIGSRAIQQSHSQGYLLAFVLTALIGATIWHLALGRGPIERLIRWATWRVATP